MNTNPPSSNTGLRQRRPAPPSTPDASSSATTTTTTKENASSMNTTNNTNSSSSMLIIHLYSIIWCGHYIIPYLDLYLYQSTREVLFDYGKKHLKFIPALDHRPMDMTVWDAYTLLPLVLYILYLYLIRYRNDIFTTKNTTASSVHVYVLRHVYMAHIIDTIIIRGMIRMPYVWDHEQWASLCNLMFLGCYTHPLFLTKSTRTNTITTTTNWFLQQEAYLLGILYGAAAFWKCTTSFWYHTTTSCGSSLVLETIATYYLPGETVPTALAQFAVDAGPHLTFIVEAGISVGMMYLAWTSRTANRSCGDDQSTTRKMIRDSLVLMTVVFHLTIYMLPINAAGGFSLDCMTRLVFFLHPQEVFDALVVHQPHIYTKISRYRVWMICALVWVRYKGTGYPMDFGYLLYGLVFDLYIMILFPSASTTKATTTKSETTPVRPSDHHTVPSITKILSFGMLLVGLLYGVGLTILGLEQMGAPTMYSNLRSYYGGNHLLVPTGILGDDILYGGRLVQVTFSTCDALNQMLGYIDSAEIEPEPLYSYQKSLLRNASIPHTPIQNQNLPIQFVPLCICNPHSKKLLIDYYRKSNPIGQPAPFQFILPINVVKRALQTAQKRKESFVVKIADGGRSSELKQPPSLIEGVTEVIVLNEQMECTVELYKTTSNNNNTNDESSETATTTTTKGCSEHFLAQMLLLNNKEEGNSWMNYIVSKLLIPYPQIVGETEEVCMS